jgi:hypothetical protein
MSKTHRVLSISLVIAGWAIACVAVAGIISLWYAVKLAFASEPYRTPEAWVIGRAFLFGLPFATLPVAAYMLLSRTSRDSSQRNTIAC